MEIWLIWLVEMWDCGFFAVQYTYNKWLYVEML